ncbi:aminotransferase class IV, partial [Lysinibacillus sp. D4B1_S16]|uniref:aminotransferase class IV n=1 Tax=Lysinibacillus sp. D4B1_S16 TaxID=2941231 RepID=UPI0020BD9A92
GVTSNVFWVKNDKLYTPSLETGILPGIARARVIKKADALGLEVREGFYTKEDLRQSTECFITNSVQELVPIIYIENQQLLGN